MQRTSGLSELWYIRNWVRNKSCLTTSLRVIWVLRIALFAGHYFSCLDHIFSRPKLCNTDDCITGCEAYQIGLVNGCSYACNQTLQERPACVEGCKRAGQKLVTKILDSIQSITPVRVLQNKTDSSVTLSFSKDYERTIKSNYPFIYPGNNIIKICYIFAIVIYLPVFQSWNWWRGGCRSMENRPTGSRHNFPAEKPSPTGNICGSSKDWDHFRDTSLRCRLKSHPIFPGSIPSRARPCEPCPGASLLNRPCWVSHRWEGQFALYLVSWENF